MLDPSRDEYNPALVQCIKKVPRMPGCESAYFFPKDVDVCSSSADSSENVRAGSLVVHVRSGDIFTDAILSYYGQVR